MDIKDTLTRAAAKCIALQSMNIANNDTINRVIAGLEQGRPAADVIRFLRARDDFYTRAMVIVPLLEMQQINDGEDEDQCRQVSVQALAELKRMQAAEKEAKPQ